MCGRVSAMSVWGVIEGGGACLHQSYLCVCVCVCVCV